MKTITIERVRNGWLVRPFNTSRCFDPTCRGDENDVYVYKTIEDLQKDLPMLCEWEPPCSIER